MARVEDRRQSSQRLTGTGFFRLWIGDFVSNAGSSMVTFLVPVIGITVLGLSAVEVSWVVAAGLSAPLFISLSAGVIADRARRPRLLHVCNLGRFAVFVVVATLLVMDDLTWPVLAIALFVVGVMTLLYESAMAAAVPAVVPRSLLIRANSWIEGGLSVTESAGPALGGVILAALQAPFVMALNAATYLFSSVMLLGLPLNRSETDDEDSREPSGDGAIRTHLLEIRLGLSLLWKQVPQRVVLLAATAYNFFDSWILAVFAAYALQDLAIAPAVLGLVFVLPTVMGVAGSIAAERIGQVLGLGRTLTLSFCLIAVAGLFLPATAITQGWSAALIISVVFAVFEVCIVVNLIIGRSMRQSLFPERHLSKIAGTSRFVSWSVDPIGALAGGAVAGMAGVQTSVLVGSVGFVLGAVICLSSPSLRGFRRLPET